MSVKGRVFGSVVGAAGLAAAAGAVGIARQNRVIGNRAAGETVAFGELHSPPRVVVADDGLALHVEIDEPADFGGRATTDDDLTVVFVHGYSLNLACWHYQRAAYRGQVRTVFYDQRSHGRSARSDEKHCTIEQLGHDLRRVIETTVPGPCVVVGHSMGGMSVISLAQQHPDLFGDKVRGAALISTTAGGLDPGRILFPMLPLGLGGRFVGRAVRTLDRGHKAVDLARSWGHAIADVITDRYAFGDDVPASHVDFVYSMLDATPFAVVADFYPAFATLDHFDHLAPLGQVPTSIICGTADKITSVGHSRKLHSRIPGSSLLECEGAGHMVLLERHKQVTAELDDLISLAQGQDLS
ncbi:alpha/beta fold hydrolase [Nocardioides sp. zg-1228]|uniref:alpha/beta fold hydrolase n=1 Tax=Nocardioides sp. zg-1228 TaxID=2763008 RepID=UPI00164339B6|nr:alpha/beta hydrolase [Nocardioides sp. zg-1228]MBC2934799.1 alpha/beta hydrolase [Nocardioides sp. zg-1228]QSF58410.1 alpha/beta hydrolase [Nocardioides sp. zg-1228]